MWKVAIDGTLETIQCLTRTGIGVNPMVETGTPVFIFPKSSLTSGIITIAQDTHPQLFVKSERPMGVKSARYLKYPNSKKPNGSLASRWFEIKFAWAWTTILCFTTHIPFANFHIMDTCLCKGYRETSNTSRTLVGIKIVDHSSSFST